MEGSVPHSSARKRCADLAGSVPLGQISNHTVAKDLVTIQQALLRTTPGRLRRSPGVLGLVHAARTRMAGDLTAHHRGATPNQVGDTHLGQAHIHPRHDRRAIQGSKHPTTPHDQPQTASPLHENCLHPTRLPSLLLANQNISEDGVFKLNGPPNYEEPVDYENEVTSRVVDVGELALNHKGVRVSDRDVLLVKK